MHIWRSPQEDNEEDMDLDTNDDSGNDGTDDFHAETEAVLRPMYEACAASQMLENAVMLSVVTAEALSACRERLQESSLGRVVIGGGEAWVDLARRLRMCLFFDHRLHSGVLAEQARCDFFSWVPCDCQKFGCQRCARERGGCREG